MDGHRSGIAAAVGMLQNDGCAVAGVSHRDVSRAGKAACFENGESRVGGAAIQRHIMIESEVSEKIGGSEGRVPNRLRSGASGLHDDGSAGGCRGTETAQRGAGTARRISEINRSRTKGAGSVAGKRPSLTCSPPL